MTENNIDAMADEPSEQLVVPLALLRLNHLTPVRGLTRCQVLVFLAQQGGLPSDPIERSIGEVFQFAPRKHGPYSSALTDILERATPTYVRKSEVPGAEATSVDLEITDTGITLLNANTSVLAIESIETLKLTKSLYNSMPVAELLDKISVAYPEHVNNK